MRLSTKILVVGALVASFVAGREVEDHLRGDDDERLRWRVRVLELQVDILDARASELRRQAEQLGTTCNAFLLHEKM